MDMSVNELSKLTGFTPEALRRLARQGNLPGAYRLGGRWLINKGEFERHRNGKFPRQDELGLQEEKINKMSVKKFRQLGYLQELNRQFLHPLGLAMEVIIDDETGKERFGQVWDYRDDQEGLFFCKSDIQKPDFQEKSQRIWNEWLEKERIRKNRFGKREISKDKIVTSKCNFAVQPLNWWPVSE